MKGCKQGYNKMHRLHEGKESMLKEAFEHEPTLHRVPKTTLKIKKIQ